MSDFVSKWIYMTKSKAKHYGFTHSGHSHFIPLWIDMTNPSCPSVATKVPILEPLLTAANVIGVLACELMGQEPTFRFDIGKEI